VSDWARAIVAGVNAFQWVYILCMAGYALYAWLKLRDNPLAIWSGGVALCFFGGLSDLLFLGAVGLLVSGYGFFLMRGRRYPSH